MRIEKSVTSITWIPSEAISGMPKLPFELGVAHYDDPPPEQLENLDALREADAFREANELRAWIEVEDGEIVDHGYEGRGLIGVTRMKLGPKTLAFAAVQYPIIQHEPEVGPGWVRFVQSAGGHMGLPAPRRVHGKPFFKIESASAWTTLQLIVYADGTARGGLVGASAFPRHWVYDDAGRLVEKSGTVDFEKWYRESHGENTPWGGADDRPITTEVESELERALSRMIMAVTPNMPRRSLAPGEVLVEQGDAGGDLYLLLDGVLEVEVDGETVAQVGPGAIVGERAVLEEGTRTATLRAATPVRVAVMGGEWISPEALSQIAETHQRERV